MYEDSYSGIHVLLINIKLLLFFICQIVHIPQGGRYFGTVKC